MFTAEKCPTRPWQRVHVDFVAPHSPWLWDIRPWQRVHVGFAEKNGKIFLVVADSHSKWLEVLIVNSTTAGSTVTELRKLFAAYGQPESMVSDNGPQFTSEEFETFLKLNGAKHVLCPPYHPASNDLAERNVQTFKNMLEYPCNIGFLTFCFNTEILHTASQALLLLNCF